MARQLVKLADLAASSVDSSKIVDGTIIAADHADQSVTNAKLGTDTARLNLLTNGGFEIWQRGNGPFTGNATYGADRWLLSIGGSSTLSVSRGTGNGSPYAAGITYTQNAQSQMIQKLEQVGQLVGKTVTFSVDIQANVAGAMRVLVWDALGPLNYSSYHTGGGTWQRLTSSCAVASNATQVQVYIEFGATVTGAVDNAMLVVGSTPADYQPLHPADDLARCLRYYERLDAVAGQGMLPGQAYGAGASVHMWPYKTQKAVIPTVTATAVTTFAVWNAAA